MSDSSGIAVCACLCRIICTRSLRFRANRECKTTVRNWKKFVAGKHGVEWQRDFFDRRVRDHHELEEKTSYILMNPVRQGLCQRAEDWVWVYRPNDRPPPLWGLGETARTE
jgi:hypothetical protein